MENTEYALFHYSLRSRNYNHPNLLTASNIESASAGGTEAKDSHAARKGNFLSKRRGTNGEKPVKPGGEEEE